MGDQVCPSCYKTTTYKYEKAKFCSHCGSSFTSSFVPPPRPAPVTATYQQPVNYPPPQHNYPPVPNHFNPSQSNYGAPPFPPPNEYDPDYYREQAKEFWKRKISVNPRNCIEVQAFDVNKGMKLYEVASMEHASPPPENKTREQVLAELGIAERNGKIEAIPMVIDRENADIKAENRKLIRPNL